jgi:DNA-binding MarR family transcriptional regulator
MAYSRCMTGSDDVTALERALVRVARAVGRLDLPAAASGAPLGKEAYWMLVRVEEVGPMRTSDLAALLKLDASTVSRQTHKLVDAGLIERRIDPVDGRACQLAVSERGREALEEAVSFRRIQLAELLKEWSARDRGSLTTLLDRLADDLQHPVLPDRLAQPS